MEEQDALVLIACILVVVVCAVNLSTFQEERPLFVFGGNPKKTSDLESPILRE